MEASREEALRRLRAAREQLVAARGHVAFPRDEDPTENFRIVAELTAGADADLCAACEALGVPSPPAKLIPALAITESPQGEFSASLISLFRVRLWIGRRRRLVDRLIALHADHGEPDSGPYR